MTLPSAVEKEVVRYLPSFLGLSVVILYSLEADFFAVEATPLFYSVFFASAPNFFCIFSDFLATTFFIYLLFTK
jgi:hypothetical protein